MTAPAPLVCSVCSKPAPPDGPCPSFVVTINDKSHVACGPRCAFELGVKLGAARSCPHDGIFERGVCVDCGETPEGSK